MNYVDYWIPVLLLLGGCSLLFLILCETKPTSRLTTDDSKSKSTSLPNSWEAERKPSESSLGTLPRLACFGETNTGFTFAPYLNDRRSPNYWTEPGGRVMRSELLRECKGCRRKAHLLPITLIDSFGSKLNFDCCAYCVMFYQSEMN